MTPSSRGGAVPILTFVALRSWYPTIMAPTRGATNALGFAPTNHLVTKPCLHTDAAKAGSIPLAATTKRTGSPHTHAAVLPPLFSRQVVWCPSLLGATQLSLATPPPRDTMFAASPSVALPSENPPSSPIAPHRQVI